MENARKMALVPEQYLSQIYNSQALFPEPYLYLSKLDSEMKRILEDKSLAPDVKVKQYGSVLKRFLGMRKAVLRNSMKIGPPEKDDFQIEPEVTEELEAEAEDITENIEQAPDNEVCESPEIKDSPVFQSHSAHVRKSTREKKPTVQYEPASGKWMNWR